MGLCSSPMHVVHAHNTWHTSYTNRRYMRCGVLCCVVDWVVVRGGVRVLFYGDWSVSNEMRSTKGMIPGGAC